MDNLEEVISREKCTGCSACLNSCQIGAIKMMVDKIEGFKYPIIDKSRCINCGICRRVCPSINTKQRPSLNKAYVAYAKEENIRLESTAGGIFTLIANHILNSGGTVIGAAFDSENKLRHVAITDESGMKKLRGSKYIQSDINEIFSFVRNNLRYNRILFCGTPCQVAGLKSYITEDYNNLICIDMVCNGVSSPTLFSKYIMSLELQGSKVLDVNFKDKSLNQIEPPITVKLEDKNISERPQVNKYMKIVLTNVPLRPSCYSCNFKLGNRYADITLGNFPNVRRFHPKFDIKSGVSSMIVHTDLGVSIFEDIKNEIEYEESTIDNIVKVNPALAYSVRIPKKRAKFFKDLNYKSMDDLTKKYGKKGLFYREF